MSKSKKTETVLAYAMQLMQFKSITLLDAVKQVKEAMKEAAK